MVCAGAVSAQYVGGKATRDALLLGSLPYTALPNVVMATAVFSLVFVALNGVGARHLAPGILVPMSFAASGLLFLVESLLVSRAPVVTAVLVYLHISGAGPVLGSGFWLVASERFDPRTAKRRFGQIAASGTVGGLLSGILAERVAAWFGAAAMLPFLAAFHLLAAWQVRQLAAGTGSPPPAGGRAAVPLSTESGLHVLRRSAYLRRLAAVVILGSASAGCLDYLFKVEAVSALGQGDALLRLFAIYYTATSLLMLIIQTSGTRFALRHFGLAATASSPSIALIVGGAGGLLAPGFQSMLLARAAESVCRGSLFRTGYESFYAPVAASEKRAAKSIIDVGADRLGDITAGGFIQMVLAAVAAPGQYPTILATAMVSSSAAIVVASRLNRGYVQTLETNLLNRALDVDLSSIQDLPTRTLVLSTLEQPTASPTIAGSGETEVRASALATTPESPAHTDPEVQQLLSIRTHDRERTTAALRHPDGISALLVAEVIPLLAWDAVARDALFALRKIADERAGQLTDALIHPNQDFVVRRRLARVFSVCVSQRAADGLLLGLDDTRFEVRYYCGLSLASVTQANPRISIDPGRIFPLVQRETAVGRPVWESRRMLDTLDDASPVSPVDTFVRDRAGQSLAHVFTLLSLVLPREPLQIAFRCLQADDRHLRGTALEYLESVLPASVRDPLWPYLEDSRPASGPTRPRDELLAELLRSNQSILLQLGEIKRRMDADDVTTGIGV
jgi:AAA family ATP:ADP antiporter